MKHLTVKQHCNRLYLIAIALLFSSCTFAQGTRLSWSGDIETARSFMGQLAELYKAQKKIDIQLKIGGTSQSIRDVASKKSDFGGSSRHLLDRAPEELGVTLYPIVWDGLVVVVNKAQTISNISLEQLRDLYNGNTNNWSQLGGADAELHFFTRTDRHAGVDYSLRQLLLSPGTADTVSGRTFDNADTLEAAVEKDAQAIGVTTISSARSRNLKILTLDGVSARYNAIKDGSYPLYHPIYITARNDSRNRRHIQNFLRFVRGSAAKRIIKRNGIVPYTEGFALVSKQLDRKAAIQARLYNNQP